MVMFHQFVSAVADGADATVVRPSNWNDEHYTPRTLTASAVIPAGSAAYMPGPLEVGSGFTLEVGSGGVLEVG